MTLVFERVNSFMSIEADTHWHEMDCSRIDKNSNGDLEFEFDCLECDYKKIVPLFEVLAAGDVKVSHTSPDDGPPQLLVTLKQIDIDVPQVFKDFFDSPWPGT